MCAPATMLKVGVMVHAYIPNAGEAETKGSWELLASQSSQMHNLQVHRKKVASSEKVSWRVIEEDNWIPYINIKPP